MTGERHGSLYDDMGEFTLDEYVLFMRRGYCLVCETTIHGEDCLCTSGSAEDDDDDE